MFRWEPFIVERITGATCREVRNWRKQDQATAELHKSSAHVQIKCPRVMGGSWDWREFVTRPRPQVGWKLEYGHPRLTWRWISRFDHTSAFRPDSDQDTKTQLNCLKVPVWRMTLSIRDQYVKLVIVSMLKDAYVRQSCWRLVLSYLVTIHRLCLQKVFSWSHRCRLSVRDDKISACPETNM